MGNHAENYNYSCIGIGNLRRACKLIVWRRHPHKRLSLHNKVEAKENLESIDKIHKGIDHENRNNKAMNCVHNSYNDQPYFNHQNVDILFRSCPPLSRSSSEPTSSTDTSSASGLSPLPPTTAATSPAMARLKCVSQSVHASLAIGRWPIMYSNSNGTVVKPPAMEKKLECTLEELCFGCIKKIKIRRDVVTENGQIIQEEEVLTIKVKPGWTTGTKITFEGMGNETPGTHPADIVFVIEEKMHPFFSRDGDDLELAIEIPLVKALTGCTLSIPLVRGESMSLTLDDIVYPGYKKIIEGHGMTVMKEQGKRGNLVLTFLIEFPDKMTEEQRSDVYSILEDCFGEEDDDDGICST